MLQIKVLPYISHIRHAYLASGGGAGPAFAGGQMCLYQVYCFSYLYFVKIIYFSGGGLCTGQDGQRHIPSFVS